MLRDSPAIQQQPPRAPSVSSRLYVLVLACVLSAVLSAILLIAYAYQRERDSLLADAKARTLSAADSVERELIRLQGALSALGTSPSIAARDFRNLHAQATEVVDILKADSIVMRDRSGQQVFNTRFAYGEPLAGASNMAVFQPLFDTGRPLVTDLFKGSKTGDALVAVAVLAKGTKGAPDYALNASMSPHLLAQVLAQSHFPENWLVTLFDSTGTTIARTRAMDRFMGKKAGPQLLPLMLTQTQGVFDGPTRDGVDTTTVFMRIGATGWTVSLSVPQEQFTEGLWSAVWLLCGVAAVILLGGFLLAWLISLRIARSIRQLGAQAQALGGGGIVELPPLYFREADELGQAYTSATRALLEADSAVASINAELEQVNARLQSFAYALAHDLRQPLVTAAGFGNMLDKRLKDAGDSTGCSYLQRVIGGMAQVDKITNALLELARISRAGFRPQLVDLSALALASLHRLQQAEPQRPVEISVQPDMKAFGDIELLAIALEHLIGNAWKFSAGRTPAVIAVGSGNAPGGGPMWWVKDNGVGFDMAHADKLFLPFHRLHGVAEFPGVGTGLSNVHAAIARHGGKVWAESAPGEGATFFFTLNVG